MDAIAYRLGRTLASIALLTAMVAAVGSGGEARAEDLTATWKDGLVLSNDEVSMKIGGRIHNDWAVLWGDDAVEDSLGKLQDGTEFRRTRIAMQGKLRGGVLFKLQYDFAKIGEVSFKDVYMGLDKIPGLPMGLLLGQFKQPVSLEELTSSNYVTFMERSQANGFVPSRETGVQLHGLALEGDRLSWAASMYRTADAVGKATGDGVYNFAGRLTGLPWRTDAGDLLHLGASATRRESPDETFTVDLQPESHLMPEYSTLELPASSWVVLGGEAATVVGSLSLQGEYLAAMVNGTRGGPDATLGSFYVEASFFLTGEKRPYRNTLAAFGRVRPKRPFGVDGGLGALELAARFSRMDLNDGDVQAGDMNAGTFAANWYLNPNARIMLNYVLSDGDSPGATGVSHAVQTRVQVAF